MGPYITLSGLKGRPYNSYTRAHSYQECYKLCDECGEELLHWREAGHQHWRHGNFRSLVEINGIVYVECHCGNLIRTRLKPMAASEGKIQDKKVLRK